MSEELNYAGVLITIDSPEMALWLQALLREFGYEWAMGPSPIANIGAGCLLGAMYCGDTEKNPGRWLFWRGHGDVNFSPIISTWVGSKLTPGDVCKFPGAIVPAKYKHLTENTCG